MDFENDAISRMPLSFIGGAERDRTDDLLLAKQALSQLSYSPPLQDKLPPDSSFTTARLLAPAPYPGLALPAGALLSPDGGSGWT